MDNPPNIPRRHRKRFSAVRLSSDTTTTLPEYTSSPSWNTRVHQQHTQIEPILPSDRPPDYPDSAEEGDADTSSEESASEHTTTNTLVYVPQVYSSRSAQSSPRRFQYRRPGSGHRHRYSNPKVPRSRSRGGSLSSAAPTTATTTGEDPYLDSLLERSVNALEMSNALLQSSISTQTSLSTILASPDTQLGDNQLEARARGLSSRIRSNKVVHKNWAEDLDEIRRDVERLFVDGEGGGIDPGSESDELGLEGRYSTSAARRVHRDRRNRGSVDSVSSSLPTSAPLSTELIGNRQHRRRPSLDLRHPTSATVRSASENLPQLRLSPKHRQHLIAHAPRALTQYIESTEDPSVIHLPSTLGLRSGSSAHSAFASTSSQTHSGPSHSQVPSMTTTSSSPLPAATVEPHPMYSLSSSTLTPLSGQTNAKSASTISLPIVTDTTPAPTTPAYNMLSSFVYRPNATPSGTSTPSSFISTSFLSAALSRRSSSNNTKSRRRSSSPTNRPKPFDITPNEIMHTDNSDSRSRSTTPKPVYHSSLPTPNTVRRSMTPPIEEESSSSSDGPSAKKTIVSLRKILDHHPSTSPPHGSSHSSPSRSVGSGRRRLPKPPKLLFSPPPHAEAGTSTATASISRLYTKAKHTASTRPPSPPRHSSLKGGSSGRNTPNPGSPGGSSGRSTPKRISFAESPEGYPGTGSSAGRLKIGSKSKGKGKEVQKDSGLGKAGWWAAWLLGGSLSDDGGSRSSASSRSARMDEEGGNTSSGLGVGTLTRNWGPRMGIGGGFDEWGV